MKVTITHSPLPGLPALAGPHELAWSYILDAVFADAYHAGVGHMEVLTPGPEYEELIRVRAELSASESTATKSALAQLGGSSLTTDNHTRIYGLGFGTLAPAPLRRTQQGPFTGFALVDVIGVYTPAAKMWGIPIRVAAVAGRRDLVNRALAAMRHQFAVRNSRHAYYVLRTWSRV